MNKNNQKLISALRETADKLRSGIRYEWGHMGRCNCGHLIQTVTNLSDIEIVKAAGNQLDEWTEHATDYCEGTGSKVEDLFLTLKNIGFGHKDVIHLENLSDERVLKRVNKSSLKRNNPEHVSLYMNTMAEILEEA